jgi:D-glycero-D-manno-heptose 1,7-bisphosphate phosphatase
MAAKQAVFFDYGGTLSPSAAFDVPSERAADAISAVNRADLLAVVVSNQKGVAQARLTWKDLLRRRDAAVAYLNERGAMVDAWYFCPHDPGEGCACRKPAPGLLLAAARELGIDLRASAVIGDRDDRDVAAGRAVGALTALILRDHKSTRGGIAPDVVGPDVLAVTHDVVARLSASRGSSTDRPGGPSG